MVLINLPEHYNYIAIFLTLNCNLTCSYCINHTVGLNSKRRHLNADEWITAINRINSFNDLPISLQGGEPSMHSGFLKILNGINAEKKIDLLTNLQFDLNKFTNTISNKKFSRDLPYPSIRVSYHPETMELNNIVDKVKFLHDKGYSVGIFIVDHPESSSQISKAQELCQKHNLFFKTKDFLGEHKNKKYGQYHYQDSVFSSVLKDCLCKTSELLISPEGDVFRCHHDLYNKILPQGSILNENFKIDDLFKPCQFYGKCNPCDVKLKNNRFQEFGHCSVEIKDVREPHI
ncbi:MAG: radical SAM protein [Bacteriovoracaceae bacterium]|jgi:organic radical activating enzyme|nr:radical SAM protein [Bacteriovoracaceae bacterium]